jgi:hypothetical protein
MANSFIPAATFVLPDNIKNEANKMDWHFDDLAKGMDGDYFENIYALKLCWALHYVKRYQNDVVQLGGGDGVSPDFTVNLHSSWLEQFKSDKLKRHANTMESK